MENKLTTKNYWETYYKKNHASKEHITKVCSYYDNYWDILFHSEAESSSLIEIGGFPGRYLSYLSSKYGVEPTCLDFNSDKLQIEESFLSMGISNYTIIQEDFTNFKPSQKYDFVLSNGFVEHFENYDKILDLHCQYLKSGGKMLIMIPNMRGYIKLYKYLVDYKNLKIHNLKCMKLKVFKQFADRNNLSINHLSYFGGFPYNVHQKLSLMQKLIYKSHHLLFKNYLNKVIEQNPTPYFSSGLILIVENKE